MREAGATAAGITVVATETPTYRALLTYGRDVQAAARLCRQMPGILVLDARGRVAHILVGELPDAAALVGLVRELVD